MGDRVTVGTLEELRRVGCLTGKAGTQPICVFWSDEGAFALDDRCPHMGFPLHRGTVESGLVTCHWHNARFDLSSGGTLDPWADDVRAYPVELDDGRVTVVIDAEVDRTGYLMHRLEEGLEQGITLVIAKAVLGLLDHDVTSSDIVRAGVEFGTRYRQAGWGAGLTVLTAMTNVLGDLDPADVALALVHGLAFVSRDTLGRAPRFALLPLGGQLPAERLAGWYRRFVETRSADAAERTLASAVATLDATAVSDIMFAAVTDHVFIDGGHTIDFTNKAFEAVEHLGWETAPDVLPTLVTQTASASRSEERGAWRFPHDLAAMISTATSELPDRLAAAAGNDSFDHHQGVTKLAWSLLSDDPAEVVAALDDAISSGAKPEELGRAVAYAAALRITRFHTQNDHGDWDEVHHAFTAANAVHQAIRRGPRPSCCALCTTGLCASTSTASSTCPPPVSPLSPPRVKAPTSGICSTAGTRRDESMKPAPSSIATCSRAATPPERSQPSVTHCSPRTPSSTGSRPSRRQYVSSTPGQPGPKKAP